jgi:endonuclease III
MPRETVEAKRRRAEEIIDRLRRAYPEATISLRYENDMQLLVAVILSAQCTDAMVNRVTDPLFQKYRTVDDFAAADRRTFEREIRPTGFFRSKTRNILAMARAVRDGHAGRVPRTMEELVELPGVGRKTANVVLWNAFGQNEGIAVDTHVARITRLLRLTRHEDPAKIERDLLRLVPAEARGEFTHLFISHGRAVCVANRPRCERCPINSLCPSARRPPVREWGGA